MIKIYSFILPILVLIGSAISFNVCADEYAGAKPVDSGAVIRGVTLKEPHGTPGTSTGKSCDFKDEEVDQHGNLTGASVNCKPKANAKDVLQGLPVRFNAYCVIQAPVKSARLLQAPLVENDNHCDLSGITPKNAETQFKGAVWR